MLIFSKKIGLFLGLYILVVDFSIIANNSAANSLLIDQNEKIVLGGSFLDFNKVSAGLDFLLVRYNNDGSLDTSFNANGPQPGVVATPINNNNDFINSIALDLDNKIVAAGVSTINNVNGGTSESIAVARYLNNGELDTTFNPNGFNSGIPGIVITRIQGIDDIANDVVVDRNNKIIVVGSSAAATINSLGNIDVAVVRYNNDGSLDTTFNSNGLISGIPGIVLINISAADPQINISGPINIAKAVVIDQNNKIVIAGHANNGLVVGFLIIRLNEDGSLDSTFNPSGIQTGVPGTVITNITSNSEAVDLIIDNNNKILVAGTTIEDTTNQQFSQTTTKANISSFALARYNPDGSLDNTFNPNAVGNLPGIVIKNFSEGNNNEIATSVALDLDNNIVVSGYSQLTLPDQLILPNTIDFGEIDFLTAKFNSNGTVDTSFNQDLTPGYVLTAIDNGDALTESTPTALSKAVAIDKANNIVVTGFSTNNTTSDVTTVRYLADGSLDPSFSDNFPTSTAGIVINNITNGQSPDPATLVAATTVTEVISLRHINTDPLVSSEISSIADRAKTPEILSPVSGFMTDNVEIPITGTAQPFGHVTVSINSQPMTRVQADYLGRWDYKVPYLENGVYEIQAVGLEPLSELALASPRINITIDREEESYSDVVPQELETTAAIFKIPIISEPLNNSTVNKSFVFVTGEYIPKKIIRLYLNERYLGQTEVDDYGKWSFRITDLENGQYTLYVMSIDEQEKTEYKSEAISFAVETKIDDQNDKIKVERIFKVSKKPGIIVSGIIEPETDIQILIDGKKIGDTKSNVVGFWEFNLSDLQKDFTGTHKITVIRKNPDGLYDHMMEKLVNL